MEISNPATEIYTNLREFVIWVKCNECSKIRKVYILKKMTGYSWQETWTVPT